MISPDLKTHYDVVIRDLESRKNTHRHAIEEHKRALEEIDQTISGIKNLNARMNGSQAWGISPAAGQKYTTISMRWAILHILGEFHDPMTSADIAEALKAGGANSRGKNFNSNVSAVLSNMKSAREEVTLSKSGKWAITETGRSMLDHIKADRLQGATAPLQLSEQ